MLYESCLKIENITVKTYGISYIDSNNKKVIYEDLSLDKEKVEKFIDILNKSNISEIHISEVIDDFLAMI